MRKFATIIFLKNHVLPEFLYKDVGSIAYGLARYYDYQASFIYLTDDKGIIKDEYYEKYVKLIPIKGYNNKFKTYCNGISFMWNNAINYDIINCYPTGIANVILACIAKSRNRNIKIYMKFDMNRQALHNKINSVNSLKYKITSYLYKVFDLYTVETKSYVERLNKLEQYAGKVKYLPNGFFSDLVETDSNIKKEKIILTVGRIGAEEKNTEMLIKAIQLIKSDKLVGWKVVLVGTITNEFKSWYERELENRPDLKDVFVITGHISNKKELYTIYAKSSVFIMTSHWEGFPLSLQEALHFGNYPIVTDCSDAFKDIILEGEDGFGKIIPNENVDALKIAIEEVLEHTVDFNKKGRLAGKFVDERFNWKDICRSLDQYFNKL